RDQPERAQQARSECSAARHPILMSVLRTLLVQTSRTLDRASRVLVYAAAGTLTLSHLKADIRDSWSTFFDREADIAMGVLTGPESCK
ncbi:MAG: hypothetical protein ABMA15_31695, partial [Vicinamibacterales bacterium]